MDGLWRHLSANYKFISSPTSAELCFAEKKMSAEMCSRNCLQNNSSALRSGLWRIRRSAVHYRRGTYLFVALLGTARGTKTHTSGGSFVSNTGRNGRCRESRRNVRGRCGASTNSHAMLRADETKGPATAPGAVLEQFADAGNRLTPSSATAGTRAAKVFPPSLTTPELVRVDDDARATAASA